MTRIIANYPLEFRNIMYTAYWIEIEQKFSNSFGDLEQVTVDINVVTLPPNEQMGFHLDESDNTATLTVYFVRYWRDNKLTPVSTPEEFYTHINFALNRAAKDFNF